MTSRRLDALTVLLLALSLATLFASLGRLPALTGDEAWLGLYAQRLAANGLFTPHEMNDYTGPLFGLTVARSFAAFGISVWSLRIVGACANALAFVLLLVGLRRRAGAEAAAWGAALIASSSYLLLKSRLAWEVYAFQPLLLSLTLMCLDAEPSFGTALALAALCLLGTLNHFIFLSVPASLVVLFAARSAWLGEEDARPTFRAALSAMIACAAVFLVKPRLSEAAWPEQRAWALPLLAALPFAAAGAARAGAWDGPLVAALRRPALRKALLAASGLGVLAFLIWHGVPLWQALSGPLVWRRVFSWTAPWALSAPLRAFGAFLFGLIAWRAVRAWHGRDERLTALWPAAYAALFIFFRNTSSLRYYSIAHFLALASLAAGFARLPRADKRGAALALGLVLFASQGVLWREISAPTDRKPQDFRIGFHMENSRDFSNKDALFAAFDASGACGVAHQERSFIAVPLIFHRSVTGPLVCDAAKSFDAETCGDCAGTPFYRWSTVSAAR